MQNKGHNHNCIICGEGYYYCNDCGAMKSFTPWRRVACSIECYQTYLAFMDYRDHDHDSEKFAKAIDQIGMDVRKLPVALTKVYENGKQAIAEKERPASQDLFVSEVEQEQAPVLPQFNKTDYYKHTRKKK